MLSTYLCADVSRQHGCHDKCQKPTTSARCGLVCPPSPSYLGDSPGNETGIPRMHVHRSIAIYTRMSVTDTKNVYKCITNALWFWLLYKTTVVASLLSNVCVCFETLWSWRGYKCCVFNLLQLDVSAFMAAAKNRPVLHQCVVFLLHCDNGFNFVSSWKYSSCHALQGGSGVTSFITID